jgi:hypothetical protein
MYYHTPFTQVLSNPQMKPVEIVLIAGDISVETHPGDEIYLAGEYMNDENQMPLLHETEETMRIDRHSLFQMFINHDVPHLKIFIPEKCDLNILLRAGHLKLKGNFGEVRARTDAGNITADLAEFTAAGDTDLVVFAGEIRLKNSASAEKPKHHHRPVKMKIGPNANLKARVSLGNLWMVA